MTLYIHRLTLFLLVFFLLSPPCFAAEQPSISDYEKGKQLFLSSNFRQARDLLFKAFRQDPANPDINFYLGRAAFELGDYETALMAYERVLIMDPEATRVKLEIARCHLRLGFKEMARQYFREVQATNPPKAVWDNIDKYLKSIKEQDKRHLFAGTFTFGLDWDDNVYATPVSDRITIFGIPGFQLQGDSAKAQDDQVYTTTMILNHVYRFEDRPTSWKTTFTNFNAFYDTKSDLDTNYFGLNSGPVWKTDKFMWNNHLKSSYLEEENDRSLSSFGFGSIFTLLVNQQINLTFAGHFSEKNDYKNSVKDASNYLINFNPVFNFGPNRISGFFYKELEDTEVDIWDYERVGWLLQYERSLPLDLTFFASGGYQLTDYDGVDAAFFVSRSDTVQQLKTGISKLLWQSESSRQNLSGQLSYTYLDSESNIDLFTYRKNVVTLSFTVGFF